MLFYVFRKSVLALVIVVAVRALSEPAPAPVAVDYDSGFAIRDMDGVIYDATWVRWQADAPMTWTVGP